MTHDLKQDIIDTATELFMSNGYMATSTRQIASILNVTQPAIYHHYKNKEAIYTAVLKQFALDVGVSLKAIVEKDLSYQETLLEMALFLKEKHPMNLSLMMHDIGNSLSPESEREIFIIWSTYYFSPFTTFFNSIEENLVEDLKPSVAAQHFLRILSAYITDEKQKNPMASVDVSDMVTIFLRGIIA